MNKFLNKSQVTKLLIFVFVLLLTSLACTSFIPSPVVTPSIPTIQAPILPPVDPALGPSVGNATGSGGLDSTSVLGEDILIAGAQHIQESAQATDWNSDPPTSGQHFGWWAQSGFYDEVIPDGYLVHNMEHGYVIIYYNCLVVDMDCESFKTAIESAITAAGNDPDTHTVKVIAVPRPSMTNPITYASWGHLYKAESFDPEELVLYVQTYRSHPDYAPEWSLP
jgi:hypothetical protein